MSTDITLRPVSEDDLPQIVNLDRLAFAPLRNNADIQREWYGQGLDLPGRSLFLAVENATDIAVGSYIQIALSVFFQGKVLPTMGIAAVAVAPHYRGRRLARQMIEHAVTAARSQQIPLLMLYPFQHGFYRKLGWAWVGRVHQYRIAARHLPLYAARSQMLPYDASQHTQALQAAYRTAAMQRNGWLQRQDWQWAARLKPVAGREIYCYMEAGQLRGYVILKFAHLAAAPHLLAAIVQEWVALTPASYQGILGFLASLRDQVSTIVWNTDSEDVFPHLLQEQSQDPAVPDVPFEFGLTHRFGAIGGGFMWRLVDLEAAFRLRPIAVTPPFTVMFRVADPILGDRSLTVAFADGQMQITDQPAALTITLTIEHLTELFCGMRRAHSLLWLGEIAVEPGRMTAQADTHSLLAQLDAAWQATPPFCWDAF